jgi:predicted dehydrogenase
MESGKHYFTDKAPLTTPEQLEAAKKAAEKTGKKIRGLLQRKAARRVRGIRRAADTRRRDR